LLKNNSLLERQSCPLTQHHYSSTLSLAKLSAFAPKQNEQNLAILKKKKKKKKKKPFDKKEKHNLRKTKN
jgi:hypothetical protein